MKYTESVRRKVVRDLRSDLSIRLWNSRSRELRNQTKEDLRYPLHLQFIRSDLAIKNAIARQT